MSSIQHPVTSHSSESHVDDQTWSSLMSQFKERLYPHGCEAFIHGFEQLRFSTNKVEQIADLSERMRKACGWTLQAVDGLLPNPQFFELLSNRTFAVADKIRRPEELTFSVLPDLFHDALGHLPLLLNPAYGKFLATYARVATKYLDSPQTLKRLTRLYWYTIETGLVMENGELKIFGAAIMTSHAECVQALSPVTPRKPFDFREVFSSDYDSFKIQPHYFVMPSIDSLSQIGDQIEEFLEEHYELGYEQ